MTEEQNFLRGNTLYLLDFDQVRHFVSNFTTLPLSKEMALTMEPSFDHAEINKIKLETQEAAKILEFKKVGLNVSGRDIRPIINKAYKQSLLTGEEIYEISIFIEGAISAKRIGTTTALDIPIFRKLSKSIPDLGKLGKEIKSKLSETGELLDTASSLLRELRISSRSSYQNALNLVQKVGLNNESSLQQNLVTIRDDRLVLAVKSDFRSTIPGVVHSVSDSGATLFVEPLEAVDTNNLWREQIAEETEESLRILAKLSSSVFKNASDLSIALEVIAHMDLCLAKAQYGNQIKANYISHSAADLNLIDAFHPLIAEEVVPISVKLNNGISGLIISGPNTGGKTLALKTVGLILLMHQTGLFVPCSPLSELPIVDGIYADIGDHQSVKDGSSTFSSHITNIAKILEFATEKSIVLLDELGTGTDPDEGTTLAMALLDHFAETQIKVIATTHYQALSGFAAQNPKFENASVDLHPKTLKPTYQLTMGMPGRSYAFPIASQLGVPPAILRRAELFLSPEKRKLDSLLVNLNQQRKVVRDTLKNAENTQRESEAIRTELEEKLKAISLSQNQIIEDTKSELKKSVKDLDSKLKHAKSLAYWRTFDEPPPPRELQSAQDQIREVQKLLKSKIWGKSPVRERANSLRIGDAVRIESLGTVGVITGIETKNSDVEVRVGDYKIKVSQDLVEKVNQTEIKEMENKDYLFISRNNDRPISSVLDIRGHRVQEALELVDSTLDQALISNIKTIRVVHGKGSGILQNAIWKHLSSHKSVESYDYETNMNGGQGATFIELI